MGLTVLDAAKEITELGDKSVENIQTEALRKKYGIQSREYKKQMRHVKDPMIVNGVSMIVSGDQECGRSHL